MITDIYTDMAGRIRILWQTSDGDTIALKFMEQPTQQQLADLEAQYIERRNLERNPKIEVIGQDEIDLIVEVIKRIRQNPGVTPTQFTNYLNTLSWSDKATVQTFFMKLARALAEKYNVSLTDFSEAAIFGKVRDWLVETEVAKLKHILSINP